MHDNPPNDFPWIRPSEYLNSPLFGGRDVARLLDRLFENQRTGPEVQSRIEFLVCGNCIRQPLVEGSELMNRDREELRYMPAVLELIVEKVANHDPEDRMELIDGMHHFAKSLHDYFASNSEPKKLDSGYAAMERNGSGRAAIHAALAALASSLYREDNEVIPSHQECLDLAAKCWLLCVNFNRMHLERLNPDTTQELEIDRMLHIPPIRETDRFVRNLWIRWSTSLLIDKWNHLDDDSRVSIKGNLIQLLGTLEYVARKNVDERKRLGKPSRRLTATITAIVEKIEELRKLGIDQ